MALWWRLMPVETFRYSFKKSTIIRPVGCVAILINSLRMTSELGKVRLPLTDCILMDALHTFPPGWFNKDVADPAKCFYRTCQVPQPGVLKSCLIKSFHLPFSWKEMAVASHSWGKPRHLNIACLETWKLSNAKIKLQVNSCGKAGWKKTQQKSRVKYPLSQLLNFRQEVVRIGTVAKAEDWIPAACRLGVWCCSIKGLPFNDISLTVRAVGLGVHLISHQFLVRTRGKTVFAAQYAFVWRLRVSEKCWMRLWRIGLDLWYFRVCFNSECVPEEERFELGNTLMY